MYNRICMIINGVIGDIYGAPIEMLPCEYIHERWDSIMTTYICTDKMQERPYTYTDDTEMTIAVLDFLSDVKSNKCEKNQETMLKYFSKHFAPFRGYSSNTSKIFLDYIETGIIKTGTSNANGGLMRVSPIAFLCNYNDDESILNLINIIHYPTHIYEEAIHTSYIYIKILLRFYELRESKNKKQDIFSFLKELHDICKYHIKNIILMILNEHDNDEYEMLDNFIGLDGILCYETLGTALWCIVKNIDDDPKKILARGIFYGGDTDTIGSLIGQMTGMLFGLNAINPEWMSHVENIDYIMELSHNLL